MKIIFRKESFFKGLPGRSHGKESACNAGDLGSIPGLGRSGGGNSNPLQYSCLENPHGKRSLAGYSPWGRKESDIGEHSIAPMGMHCKILLKYCLIENFQNNTPGKN